VAGAVRLSYRERERELYNEIYATGFTAHLSAPLALFMYVIVNLQYVTPCLQQ